MRLACYYAVLSERSERSERPAAHSGPSGPSGPLLIATRCPTVKFSCHYMYAFMSLCPLTHKSTPYHISTPACIGVRALRRAHLMCLPYVYRMYSVWMYLPVPGYGHMTGHQMGFF